MDRILADLEHALSELTAAAERAAELSDRVPDLAASMTLDQMAELTVILKDAREAASHAKTRCTFARDRLDDHFCRKIANEHNDTAYRTATHTFSASAEGFYSGPSPLKDPEAFNAFIEWIREVNGSPFDINGAPIEHSVLHRAKGLAELCEKVQENGGDLPPFIREHLGARIKVRRRN